MSGKKSISTGRIRGGYNLAKKGGKMERKRLLAVVLIFACLVFSLAYAEEAVKEGVSRYTLYTVELDEKPVLVLLDTATGKIWMYQKELSTAVASEQKFKGVTVEGVAYSLNDAKKLEQYMNDLNSKGLLEKDVKGFTETMTSEFSYYLDLNKIRAINYELKLGQRSEKEK
jgi:hypothetical protein